MQNDGSVYGPTKRRIWIDSIVCDGSEQSLDACHRSNWGETNCDHKEDTGCICLQNASRGGCDNTRHRIIPFDANHPNIGRVEVQDDDKSWGLICDDDWDNIDARVFCDCLGYKGSHQFLALQAPNHTSDLPMLYDSVHCKANDTTTTKNLWDCKVTKATGKKCDPKTEAAAVMCGAPAWVPPVIPDIRMSCDGQDMSGCLLNEFTDLSPIQFSFSPNCSHAFTYQNTTTRNICFRIDMGECWPSHNKEVQSNDSVTHYCYDLVYSKMEQDSGQLRTSQAWSRRLCCIVRTNATSTGSFLPQVEALSPHYAHNSRGHSFDMQCYLGVIPTSGKDLTFPLTIRVGEPVSCMVSAVSWDPHPTLVVSDCKFMTSSNGSGLESYFIKDKCITAKYNDLIIDNGDQLHWGFKFGIRKFDGYNELYMSCNVYLCRATKQAKPYCDRSCARGEKAQGRTGERETGKSEDMDDGMTGSVRKGPFRFYDIHSQFLFANPEDHYVSNDKSEDNNKQNLEEYKAFMQSKSSDDSLSWWHVCVFACLHHLGAAVKVVFGA